MKAYNGNASTKDRPLSVTVRDEKGAKILAHHLRHSPTGYNWGYGGSGPSELARCILLNAFGTDVCPDAPQECRCENSWTEASYPAFRDSVIAGLKQDEDWKLHQEWIMDWVFDYVDAEAEVIRDETEVLVPSP